MYDPKGNDKGREWIEIFNAGNCEVNLTNWKFFESNTNHKIKLVFGSTVLRPNQFAIISNNATKFKEEYPSASCSIFQSSFSLSNVGEFIAIKNSSLHIIDSINYSSSVGANDNGKSLELKNGIWVESSVNGGTPCEQNSNNQKSQQEKKEIGSFSSPYQINTSFNFSNNNITSKNLNESSSLGEGLNISNEEKSEIMENRTSGRNANKTKEAPKTRNLQTGLFSLSPSLLSAYIFLIVVSVAGVSLFLFTKLRKKLKIKKAKIDSKMSKND